MIIKRTSELAKTKMRRDAVKIFEAGLNAVETKAAVRRAVRREKNILSVGGKRYDLNKIDHLYVVGFGKASLSAAEELEKILGGRITSGIVLDTRKGKLKKIRSLVGSHPFPTEKNVRAAGEIVEILKKADSKDLIVAIVSGGGSALLCRPYGLSCNDLSLVTKTLMRRGADIYETNAVRKHLSEILGGQFARLAYPAKICALIFSDVLGDDVSMVASGPTVLDKTTVKDAAAVLAKYDVIKACSLPGCDLRETPKDKIFFKNVQNTLVVGNRAAVRAMEKAAERLGYEAVVLGEEVSGEAREVGRFFAMNARPGTALIAGGETTVTVAGEGRGGRNQELALGALGCIKPGVLVAACASDGVDNATPAAGAVVDELLLREIAAKKLNPEKYLADNDSYDFFKKAGTLLVTGKTGSNVADLMLALAEK
jgi:glycerate 2-kinase